jgi:FkbM family methyltransferase
MSIIRNIAISILKIFKFDTVINNHWAPEFKLHLNTFTHKGYWWHGKNREIDEMLAIRSLISDGDCVVEVGAHIGYLTQYFSGLVGRSGQVFAFEPGEENLRYLRKNVAHCSNVTLSDNAVSDQNGEAIFFVEELSGQNNSLLKNFETLTKNIENSGQKTEIYEQKVVTVTLDHFTNLNRILPQFIKIDVEGAEKLVVDGMKCLLLKCKPTIMIETTSQHTAIFKFFTDMGYTIFNEKMKIRDIDDIEQDQGFMNSFCIFETSHANE